MMMVLFAKTVCVHKSNYYPRFLQACIIVNADKQDDDGPVRQDCSSYRDYDRRPLPSQPNPHPYKGRLQGKVKEALRPMRHMQPLRARTSQSKVSNHLPH
ncbi:hypothetical protein DPMN_027622 [Dreissena polymorpha]|uniref:Uncharacterized protein n=1 Tax=Dreissena polymorpha TaxID=45954 RepID=A0A9D4RDM2_DREPO|nr:hypothetical protein DPMN_027622 [Dreissena polymorpha]